MCMRRYCVPAMHCAPWYLESLYDPAAPCYLAHGAPGVCCPPKKPACKHVILLRHIWKLLKTYTF